MRAKVLISFSGVMTASVGDIIDINDQAIYDDLLHAQYIEPLEETPDEESPAPKKRTKKKV